MTIWWVPSLWHSVTSPPLFEKSWLRLRSLIMILQIIAKEGGFIFLMRHRVFHFLLKAFNERLNGWTSWTKLFLLTKLFPGITSPKDSSVFFYSILKENVSEKSTLPQSRSRGQGCIFAACCYYLMWDICQIFSRTSLHESTRVKVHHPFSIYQTKLFLPTLLDSYIPWTLLKLAISQ